MRAIKKVSYVSVDIVIKNCKVVNAYGTVSAGVAIDEGKIMAVARDANLPKADRVIDARGKYVIPGAIDPHTHFNQGMARHHTSSSFMKSRSITKREP